MALCETGFVIYQYDCESTFLVCSEIVLISNFSNVCGTVYGAYGEVHLWPNIKYSSLWISLAENRNWQKTFTENLSCHTLRALSFCLGADSRSQIHLFSK
jgi:hypothetical protein